MSPMWDDESVHAVGICAACGLHTDDGVSPGCHACQPQTCDSSCTPPRAPAPRPSHPLIPARITEEHPKIDETMARRIVAQTAAFLAASAHTPGQRLVPSKLVDIGWHTFILHTVDYAAFCDNVVGRFVHHVPEAEADGRDSQTGEPLRTTVAALTAAGHTVDDELWRGSATCGQCHAGCHDSPKK
ncbi:glycine-rich domain-containing protein [Streptomyces wuyuanensis]|uniref:glycine-rich domain-containing protein n=1 Tax=Streptomyces wuyuanensis TaxID=1196353 RepID=UPI00371B2040